MLQNGVSHRSACVKLSTKGGMAACWGSADLPEKVSHDVGYRSDSIAISRDMGPLRADCSSTLKFQNFFMTPSRPFKVSAMMLD